LIDPFVSRWLAASGTEYLLVALRVLVPHPAPRQSHSARSTLDGIIENVLLCLAFGTLGIEILRGRFAGTSQPTIPSTTAPEIQKTS
jgi:hypothetical protein